MDKYEIVKHRLLQIQSEVNSLSEKEEILLHTWTLCDPKTQKSISRVLLTGRSELEARPTGNLYFTIDNCVPVYERNRYTIDELNTLVTMTLMK